jgi:hypothetical protein
MRGSKGTAIRTRSDPPAAGAAVLPPPHAGEGWGGGYGAAQCHRVFGREQRSIGEVRHHPETFQAGAHADRRDAAVEQRDVAAEFVDDVADEPGPLAGREQRMRADELSDDAASLDVADQRDRHVGGLGEAHIGDVAGPQIDLGRAAGAFDQHEIGRRGEAAEGGKHHRQQGRRQRTVVACRGGAVDPAGDNDLRHALGLRLQQDRVHIAGRGDAAGARLQGLRAADLAAIDGDRGIVRHVLRLERAHLETAPGEGAPEAGDDQRLADI